MARRRSDEPTKVGRLEPEGTAVPPAWGGFDQPSGGGGGFDTSGLGGIDYAPVGSADEWVPPAPSRESDRAAGEVPPGRVGGPPYTVPPEWMSRRVMTPVVEDGQGRAGREWSLPRPHKPGWLALPARTKSLHTTRRSGIRLSTVAKVGVTLVVIAGLAYGVGQGLRILHNKPPIDAANGYLLSVQAQSWGAATTLSCQNGGPGEAAAAAQALLREVGGTIVSYDLNLASLRGKGADVSGVIVGNQYTDTIHLAVKQTGVGWLVCSAALSGQKVSAHTTAAVVSGGGPIPQSSGQVLWP